LKRKLWYILGLLAVFLAVIAVLLFRKGGSDIIHGDARLMGEATLPVVYPCYDDMRINCLYGYVGEIDIMSTRDTLTPLGGDRLFSMQIDTYGTEVKGISYEIRSIDMSRILEKTELKEWEEKDDVIYAEFQADNLMTSGTDYHLIIKLSLKDGREANYYTRFVYGLDNVKEKFEYVLDFHERTFDKEEALEIVRYLESGSKGDNTNYGAVNIYSSFQQITWGELKVERVGAPNISLVDVNGNISYFVVDYLANIENMYGTKELYRVKEYYRTRHTSTRTYLLEFERTMEQYFTPVSENIYSNNINVGITENIDNTISDKLEDSQGKRVCFVRNGELWEYYSTENRITRIFSFRGDDNDVRTSRVEHDIRIARIDNEGNVTFMVYGYMSRGEHEGEVGISVCRYNEADNKVSELLYIPYGKSFDRLSESFGGICYLNPSNWLYFILDGRLYSIDLGSREYTVLLGDLESGSYITNKAGNTLVMQKKHGDHVQEINILNLETNKEVSVKCAEDEVIKLLGYMEEDIVYGVAKKSDVFTDLSGDLVYYFYKLCIMEEDTTEVGLYKKDNIYIKEAEILDGMITLERYSKNEEGDFEAILTDYLTRNTSESRKALTLRYVTTDLKKKEAVLTITATKKEGKPEVNDEVDIYAKEDNRFELSLTEEAGNSSRYYAYAKGEYFGSFTNLSDAIRLADSKMGLVVNDKGQYIWKRGNTYNSISLSDISIQTDEENTLAACIDAMLKKAGTAAMSAEFLAEGKSIADIINSETTSYLSFEGLSLDKILYSVNDGRPVVGKLSDEEYVLITGYDSSNVIMYSAITGSRSKMNMNEAAKQFEKQGNIFFSYIK